MKIAIVEDLSVDFETLRRILKDALQAQHVECDLAWFSSGEDFLAAFAPERYDLLFLDLLLGEGMTGMDAARAVRQTGSCTPIVFTTGERDYAVESYEVQAIDYLIKPYQPERVCAVLARVLAARRTQQYLTFQTGRQIWRIELNTLVWAEVCGRYVHLHLAGGETVSLSETFERFLSRAAALPPVSVLLPRRDRKSGVCRRAARGELCSPRWPEGACKPPEAGGNAPAPFGLRHL